MRCRVQTSLDARLYESRSSEGAGEGKAPARSKALGPISAAGRYRSADDKRDDIPLDEHFVGFGRAATSAEGMFRFRTLRPGRVPGPGNSLQGSHLAVSVFGRGLLKRLATRLYFAGSEGNADDPILALVPEERRSTLFAERRPDSAWWLDIHLGGEHETVFFEW